MSEEEKVNPEIAKTESEMKPIEGDPLSRVSTYQDAIAEALRTQDMSSAGMLMAEQKKREDFKQDSLNKSFANPKNKVLLLISVILIISAAGAVTFSIIRSSNRKPLVSESVFKSKYFISEKTTEVAASQLSRNTLARIQQALTEPLEKGETAQIILTKEVKADPNSEFDIKVKRPLTTNDFLSLISARAPENIRKSLDQEFMLGTHKATKNETFVLLRVTNFENGFSGMLTWESALAKDMENIFPEQIEKARITREEEFVPEIDYSETDTASSTDENTEESTATTTEPQFVQKTIDNTRSWVDKVIRNTDARALLDEEGAVVFFYSIIDNEYIFFGSNEATFGEVMRRVRSAKLIR